MDKLLDDESIEARIPSTLVQELRKTGPWLLIFITLGVIAVVLFFLAGFGIKDWKFILLVFGIGMFLAVGVQAQFVYVRQLRWVDTQEQYYSLEQVIQQSSKVWKHFTILLFLALIWLILVFYMVSNVRLYDDLPEAVMEERIAIGIDSVEVDTTTTILSLPE